MIDPLDASMKIAGSGLESQSTRLRIISENMANAESTGVKAGADPYQRKTVTFASEMDRMSGFNLVQVKNIGRDRAPFVREHDPGNIAADENGFVKRPNVNVLIEMADMREANRTYEANLQVLKQARDLSTMTIDLLRS